MGRKRVRYIQMTSLTQGNNKTGRRLSAVPLCPFVVRWMIEFAPSISCNAICAGAMRIIAVNPALVALNLTHVPYFDYAQ